MDWYNIYKEMTSKYGFNDGAHVPFNAEIVRSIIIDYINKKLPTSCELEAYPFDRNGMHNWCLIYYRDKITKQNSDYIEPNEVSDILFEMEEDETIGYIQLHYVINPRETEDMFNDIKELLNQIKQNETEKMFKVKFQKFLIEYL